MMMVVTFRVIMMPIAIGLRRLAKTRTMFIKEWHIVYFISLHATTLPALTAHMWICCINESIRFLDRERRYRALDRAAGGGWRGQRTIVHLRVRIRFSHPMTGRTNCKR